MSSQTATGPERKARNPARVSRSDSSSLVLWGSPPRLGQVEKALRRLDLALIRATTGPPRLDARVLGVVIVAPPTNGEPPDRAVSALRADRRGSAAPLFVVVDNDTGDRAVRKIYAAGATAVFCWPREALILPRLVAELLGVSLVRGRAKGPRKALTRRLTAHLRLIPWSTAGSRAVAKSGGEVHLSGAISTYWRKRELKRLLARIPGVTRIVGTHLNVEPSTRTDRQIAYAVRSILRSTTMVDDATVSVGVRGGTLTLAGTVSNRQELERIVEIVSNVIGVRDLENSLVIAGKAKKHDGVTARRLNGALKKWFPGDRVHVAVFARVAVISGKVRNLSRRLELAQFVGQEPAITRVINKLDVA